jgi:hypothetical protein
MSVAVERRTVSLWPLNAPPVNEGPRQTAVVRNTVATDDPGTEVLAAITSNYRRGRAGIISGDSARSAGQSGAEPPSGPAEPTHLPTVPPSFVSGPRPAELLPSPPADQPADTATFWSRLVGKRPSARGRHAAKS